MLKVASSTFSILLVCYAFLLPTSLFSSLNLKFPLQPKFLKNYVRAHISLLFLLIFQPTARPCCASMETFLINSFLHQVRRAFPITGHPVEWLPVHSFLTLSPPWFYWTSSPTLSCSWLSWHFTRSYFSEFTSLPLSLHSTHSPWVTHLYFQSHIQVKHWWFCSMVYSRCQVDISNQYFQTWTPHLPQTGSIDVPLL